MRIRASHRAFRGSTEHGERPRKSTNCRRSPTGPGDAAGAAAPKLRLPPQGSCAGWRRPGRARARLPHLAPSPPLLPPRRRSCDARPGRRPVDPLSHLAARSIGPQRRQLGSPPAGGGRQPRPNGCRALNGEIFYSLKEARIVIEKSRRHYNEKQPYSSLGYRPPEPATFGEIQPLEPVAAIQ
jgi:hypothetical protein